LRRYRFKRWLCLLSDPLGTVGIGTGTTAWSAGEVLVDFMAGRASLYKGKACLELGAGLGAVGMTLAAFGARLSVLTDVERQLPLLRRNVAENFPSTERVQVHPLDWRIAEQCQRVRALVANGTTDGEWSVIVGSDLGYDASLFGALLNTLSSQCSGSTSIFLALADRKEDEEPSISNFLEEASKRSFRYSVVHERRLEPCSSLTKVLLLQSSSATVAETKINV